MPRTFLHPILLQPVRKLTGVTPRRAERLANLGIRSVGDLLFHLPRSFDDLSDVRGLDKLEAGELQTVAGEVVEMDSKTLDDGRRVLSIVIADPQGRCLEAVWFNMTAVAKQFRYGQRVAFSGKPKWKRDHWTMSHPRVEVLESADQGPDRAVVPVYPLTEGVRPDQLREHIRQALG
ncbi:MAG: hypothetical protein JOY78_12380, partial [Pseudonocardia sp.]|nr:hypothetical protein [Pseudonocardia sp.]